MAQVDAGLQRALALARGSSRTSRTPRTKLVQPLRSRGWIGPVVSRSGADGRPARTATISARIEIAVSSGVRPPMSRPQGAWIRAISWSETPAARSRSLRSAVVRREPSAPM